MTWSYSLALATAKDQVRLLVGDTDTTDQLISDEEISFFLAHEATTYSAASRAAKAIAAVFTRQADKAVGDLKISWSTISTRYLALAEELGARGRTYAVPTAGGITVNDAQIYENNSALRHGSIRKGMHDFVSNPVIPNTEQS